MLTPLTASPSSILDVAISQIYDCAIAPEKWPDTLATVSASVDGAGGLLFFQRADGSYSTLYSAELQKSAERFFADGWTTRDLRAIRAQSEGKFGKCTIVTDADLVTEEEMNSHPYYTEFLAPHGLRWFMSASISPDPKEFVVLSVQQTAERGPFGEEAKKRLEVLAGHAERSLRLSCRLMRAELANIALGEALQRVGCGVVLLNGAGKPVFSNTPGQYFAELIDGATDASKKVLAGPALAALTAEVRRVDLEGRSDVSLPILVQDRGGEHAAAYVLPVSPGARDLLAQSFGDVRTIIIFMTQKANHPVDPSIVRDVLGITLGEARLASLVGAGLSPGEAAGKLGITEETARTVLKRVFRKVNVSKQSQLTALLLQLTLRPT